MVAADTVVGAPGAPTGFTAMPVKNGVALKASATGSGISKWQYRFKYKDQNDSKYRPWRDLPSSNSNSIADKTGGVGNKAGNLRLGGTYVFQVRAVNSNGNGATSSASAAVQPLANDHIYFAGSNSLSMKEGGAFNKIVRLAEPLTDSETVTLVFSKTSSNITIDTDDATAGDQTELTWTASNWNRGQSLFVYSAGGSATDTVSVAVKAGSKASYSGKTASLSVTVTAATARGTQAKARLDHASDSGSYIVVQIADTKAAGDAGNGWALDPVQAASGEGLLVTVNNTRRLLEVRFASAGNTTAQIKTAIDAVTGFSVDRQRRHRHLAVQRHPERQAVSAARVLLQHRAEAPRRQRAPDGGCRGRPAA